MKTYINPIAWLFILCSGYGSATAASGGSLSPANLQCELRREPMGVDVPDPDLSYILHAVNAGDRGLRQTGYEIIVSSSATLLQMNKGDLWSSGKVNSDKMAYIRYAGKALISGQQCWWKVRVWDNNDEGSAWSAPSTWTMGILKEEDWKGQWISAPGAELFARSPVGFRAARADSQTIKWVQVDLGRTAVISRIRLTAVFFEDRIGYGFPPNFTIGVSDDPGFGHSVTVADHSHSEFANPGWKPVDIPANNVTGRYVRVIADRLYGSEGNFQFALRQLEVIADGRNVASGKKVIASDSNDTEGWSAQNLTDGPEEISPLRNYASMIFRKEFSVGSRLLRAVIHVSGLSQYELTINGAKIGDYLLAPGWTDYRKTVLYDSYDVTTQLQTGANAIGILLANGMSNIQPDSIRYVKFLNTFGPLQAIAQLQLEYADGTTTIIATDGSWQVAPGPVTFSNLYGGEDYDANLEPAGWNKPFFKPGDNWMAALPSPGPGGKLRGLSFAAPPVKLIQVLKPVKVTRLKDNVWIYDYGQNASMMPAITVNGEKGSYIRIIPSELLGPDGYVDRRSATQGGARPAWWQYTLIGKAVEKWKPRFFYQGARYLQVELYPADKNGKLPGIKDIEDQIVHSSSTPIGKFRSSDELFNRIYELVRWAQRSNMVSLMTDCPHREKMGWLEENHLNGPALRYNFDMAPLFRKTMNDMADAQLGNGFVPNIAPEYFIAGAPDLKNAMRNSPEWGGSFIIVPWQQYLFSGDISLLERYYDRMKQYVGFLASTAKDNIIFTGLGDWYDIGPKEPWGSQLTPPAFTATAIFYYDNWILSRVAALLGRKEDALAFSQKAQSIKEAFNNAFYKADTGQYSTESQTCNAMPVFLDLVAPENRKKLVDALVADIRKHGNSLTSGDVGYRFLLQALAEEGRSDVIFDMNDQSEKPGYGYQLRMGATSLTEKWDAGVGNFGSQNHFMLGQINEWFFKSLEGISSDEAGAGFRKIIIKPALAGTLSWVKGSFVSISGKIVSEWRRDASQLTMHISIPPNTSAMIFVPSKNEKQVWENGKPISNRRYIKFIKYENGYSVFQTGSGDYRLRSSL